ncbi:MAG: hypothetical protein KA034_01760 [Candidatus Moranbacteria bacterium]|nr:hypothetical protein [Candidatus Moranbacteria bacterium]
MPHEAPIAVSKDREDYTVSEEKLKDLNASAKNIAEMSDEEAEDFLSQRKGLTKKMNFLRDDVATHEAKEDDKIFEAHSEADQMNRDFDVADAQAKKAEQAAAHEAIAAEDAARAAALVERIKSGNIGGEVKPTEGVTTEVAQEESTQDIVEKIGAPKTEMFEKYGEKMRASAAELAIVTREMRANEKKISDKNLDMSERRKAEAENNDVLNVKRNKLYDGLMGVDVDLRRQKTGETYDEYRNYKYKTMDEYRDTVMQDPQTVLSMAEAGQLRNESIGQINERLRGNPEFMAKVLEALPTKIAAEGFFVHVRGEAKTRDLYVAAVKKNHLNYQWGPKEWATDPEIQKIALESGLDPVYLKKN